MHFDILSLFPEMIHTYLSSSMMGKAYKQDVFSYKTYNIRDFSQDAYGHVDDTLYGGGVGMLMMAEPIYQAWALAKENFPSSKCKTIYLSPKGKTFTQDYAKELLNYEQVIFLCGHYEGVDQRVLDTIDAEELSIGDFVLSGGELASLAVIDSVVRMLPGTFTSSAAYEEDSHYQGILECRQYTKPSVWRGQKVPDVLLSGNHKNIEAFRKNDALLETMNKRPDLFEKVQLTKEEYEEFIDYLSKEKFDSQNEE